MIFLVTFKEYCYSQNILKNYFEYLFRQFKIKNLAKFVSYYFNSLKKTNL